MNVRRWLHEHSLKLLAIRDTPAAIAGGVAIGIFFGFVPLFGFKTLLALFFAWLTRSNVLAAFLAATAHEVLFPLMPLIYRWQYDVGYWLLSIPHRWPASMLKMSWSPKEWWTWDTLRAVGPPFLLGSFLCSGSCALLGFFITRGMVARYHRKQQVTALPLSPSR
jgi:uncharacterized protein (DUF2062 family)